MNIEKTDWANDHKQFSTSTQGPSINWVKLDSHSLIQKGAIALSLQWLKSTDVMSAARHVTEEGGAEMMARSFAVGLLNHLDGYLSRMDLNQVALAFLLELERRNQETPNPSNCNDIAAAVCRIQGQFMRDRGATRALPRWGDALKTIDPVNTPTIGVESGERFQVEMPVDRMHGYGWCNVDISGDSVGIVSRHQKDSLADIDGRKKITTIFSFQGIHEGECRIKFTLNNSSSENKIEREVWLSITVKHGASCNEH